MNQQHLRLQGRSDLYRKQPALLLPIVQYSGSDLTADGRALGMQVIALSFEYSYPALKPICK